MHMSQGQGGDARTIRPQHMTCVLTLSYDLIG